MLHATASPRFMTRAVKPAMTQPAGCCPSFPSLAALHLPLFGVQPLVLVSLCCLTHLSPNNS
jgi:hypothetical protein